MKLSKRALLLGASATALASRANAAAAFSMFQVANDPWAAQDGRGNAPLGTPPYATILNHYPPSPDPNARVRVGGSQPPWMVAGVDYNVGVDKSKYPTLGSMKPVSKIYAYFSQSLTLATGNTPNITVASGLAFLAGESVWLVETTFPYTRWMLGTVFSYSGTTLVVNVTSFVGSGTTSNWEVSYPYVIGGNDSQGNLIYIEGPSTLEGVDFSDSGGGGVAYRLDFLAGVTGVTPGGFTVKNCYFKMTAAIPLQVIVPSIVISGNFTNCEFDGNNGQQGGTGYNSYNFYLDGNGTYVFRYCWFHHAGVRPFEMANSQNTGGFTWDFKYNVFSENIWAPDFAFLHGDVFFLVNSGPSPGGGTSHDYPNTVLDFNLFYQSNGTANGGGGENIFIRDDHAQTTYSGSVSNNTFAHPALNVVTRPMHTSAQALVAPAPSSSNVLTFSPAVPTNIRPNMIATCAGVCSGFPQSSNNVVGDTAPVTGTTVTMLLDAQGGNPSVLTASVGDTVVFSASTFPSTMVIQETRIGGASNSFVVANNYVDANGIWPGNLGGNPFPTNTFLDPFAQGSGGSWNAGGSSRLHVSGNINMNTGLGPTFNSGTDPTWTM
jgi:hypothetical protein